MVKVLGIQRVEVEPAAVDRALNARVEHSALLRGFASGPALAYMPYNVARWIADQGGGAGGR